MFFKFPFRGRGDPTKLVNDFLFFLTFNQVQGFTIFVVREAREIMYGTWQRLSVYLSDLSRLNGLTFQCMEMIILWQQCLTIVPLPLHRKEIRAFFANNRVDAVDRLLIFEMLHFPFQLKFEECFAQECKKPDKPVDVIWICRSGNTINSSYYEG